MKERLDRLVGSQTPLSRKEAAKAIRDKRVAVNGEIIRIPDAKVDPAADTVTLDGARIRYRRNVYYMMNKPAGVVSATEDQAERTVIDLLPGGLRREGVFPAGRLDKDTTGLMILTDDGDYAHRMLSPKKHVDKTYLAVLDRVPGDEIAGRFAEGITLADGTACQPAEAGITDDGRVRVTIREGKYHQVKRMFAALGYRVTALERVRIGALTLDKALAPGDVRELSEREAAKVFE